MAKKRSFVAPLVGLTVTAAVALGLTGCPSPTGGNDIPYIPPDPGGETEHTTHDWTDWIGYGPIRTGEVEWGPYEILTPATPTKTGNAIKYGYRPILQDQYRECSEGDAREEREGFEVGREEFDWTKVPEDPVNDGLWHLETIPKGWTVTNGEIVPDVTHTHSFTSWLPLTGTETDWINGSNMGGYDNVVNLSGDPVTPDPAYKYKVQQEKSICDTDGVAEAFRWKIIELAKISTISLSSNVPGLSPSNAINTVSYITGNIIGPITNTTTINDAASFVIGYELLPRLSQQAAALREFFKDSSGSAMLGSSGTLTTAENAISAKVGNTKPSAYLDLVNDPTSDLNVWIDQLFPLASEGRTLWDGYKAGHYLMTRDWRTVEPSGTYNPAATYDEGRLQAYREAYKIANGSYPSSTLINNTRGTQLPIGVTITTDSFSLPMIETKLVEFAKTTLLSQGFPDDSQTEAMIRALIIQLGQDNVEFQAFYHDIDEVGLSAANADYTATVAAIGPSSISPSSVKLASVAPGTLFDPNMVKGNDFNPLYRKETEEGGVRLA
ncbi:MAG: hypothetical protein FWG99_09080 [Treponema sp.]|nr:hypothetical protein [Treponema sp.]